jgi:5'-3' exonuclease
VRVHLVDGTYELFRHFYGGAPLADAWGEERGAVVGVVQSLLDLLETSATHVGVATDHVIESFRNELWPGYKTGDGIDPVLWSQFVPLEEGLAAAGITVWPMVEVEADDALAAAAAAADRDPRVQQVLVCTPDKDLAQCVHGSRVVQVDRRSGEVRDADGVRSRFGVSPESIPDWLALVGDSADGYPGLPGWGAKSASAVLARYERLERIPASADDWEVKPRGAARLAATLRERLDDALLFRTLATLRTDQPVVTVDELRYRGPRPSFDALAAGWGRSDLAARARRLARREA